MYAMQREETQHEAHDCYIAPPEISKLTPKSSSIALDPNKELENKQTLCYKNQKEKIKDGKKRNFTLNLLWSCSKSKMNCSFPGGRSLFWAWTRFCDLFLIKSIDIDKSYSESIAFLLEVKFDIQVELESKTIKAGRIVETYGGSRRDSSGFWRLPLYKIEARISSRKIETNSKKKTGDWKKRD